MQNRKLRLATRVSLAFGVLCACASLWSLAAAGTINIGNGAAGTNPTGTMFSLDPVLIGNGSAISVEVQGSGAILNQVLLVVLVPNDTTNMFGGTDPLGAISVYNGTFPGSPTGTGSSAFTGTGFGLGTGSGTYKGGGFWGDFVVGGSNVALSSFLSMNLSASLNSTNFLAFESSLGNPSLSNVGEFGVYTIAVTTGAVGTGSGGKVGLVNIPNAAGLPLGSIVVGLSDQPDSTVWTNTGGVDTGTPIVSPEPGSLLLMGTGLLALGGITRRRFAKVA